MIKSGTIIQWIKNQCSILLLTIKFLKSLGGKLNMLVGSNSINFGLLPRLVEPELNRDASNYIVNNYSNIIKYICKLGIKDEKAHDLLHDVYISVVESENNGNCFDMEYARDDTEKYGEYMQVSQFVYGRINLYAKNSKYKTNIIESGVTAALGVEVYYVDEIDINGNVVLNKDGTPKKVRKTKTTKQAISIVTCGASFTGGDSTEDNDGFQMAYEMAEVADTTDEIAELLSVSEEIGYCIDLCDLHGIPILSILRNIDSLSEMLEKASSRNKTYDKVFSSLHNIAQYHKEFASSLISILEFSSKNRCAFDALIQQY